MNDLLATCTHQIWYHPLADEVDPQPFFHLQNLPMNQTFLIVPSTIASPQEIAARINNLCGNSSTCLLIPGQQFDISGTRHGRGGGWYDRLLSRLNAAYHRIGVGRQDNLSSTSLLRAPWDEPMDWLLLQAENHWITYKTGARWRL